MIKLNTTLLPYAMTRSSTHIYTVSKMIDHFMKSEQEHFVTYILNHCYANNCASLLIKELVAHLEGGEASHEVIDLHKYCKDGCNRMLTSIPLTKGTNLLHFD